MRTDAARWIVVTLGLAFVGFLGCGGAKGHAGAATATTSSGAVPWDDLCSLAKDRAKRCNKEIDSKLANMCASLDSCLTDVFDSKAGAILAACLKSDDCDACSKAAIANPSAAGQAYGDAAAPLAKTCESFNQHAPFMVGAVGLLYNQATIAPYMECTKKSCDDAPNCGMSADAPGPAYCIESLGIEGGDGPVTETAPPAAASGGDGKFKPFTLKGKPAPELAGVFEGPGKAPTLKGAKGKTVIVYFWATSQVATDDFKILGDVAKKKNVVVITVSMNDNESDLKAYLAKNKIDFPVFFDPKKEIRNAYQPISIQGTYVIDKKGSVVDMQFLPMDDEKWIDKLL